MAKFEVLNVLGKKVSNLDLSDEVFNITPHEQSMFDLIHAERASLRQGTHSTKNRSDVRGGGRKPWKQKGTGRARQGSIRSPQWRGGGVVFGPIPERNYELKINKKIRKLALKSGWSQLFNQEKVVLIDNIDFKTPSTKDFKIMLNNLKIEDKKVLLVLPTDEKNYNTYLSGKNIPNVMIISNKQIMLDDMLNANKIVLTSEVAKMIEKGLSNEKN